MARIIGWLVLVFMTAIMVENPRPTVEAQQLAFSDDVTMDFTTGSIDVSNILTQDFVKLPLAGNCGLGAKFVIPHVIDTSTTKGTFRTTFEYLNRMAARGVMMRASAATGATCDWRFSNLVPVAWDGIQNVLSVGQSLQSFDSRYMFIMQQDCNLVLYKKAADGSIDWQGKWATFSQYNDPFKYNCSMELQANGNLVVRDPQGNPRWESGATTSNLYSVSIAVLACGNVIVLDMTSGQIIWATHTGHS